MQINDAQAPPPAAPSPKEEVRSVGDERGTGAEARSGGRFRDTLRRKRRGDSDGRDAATAAAMTGWFRHETTSAAPAGRAPPRARRTTARGRGARARRGPGGERAAVRAGELSIRARAGRARDARDAPKLRGAARGLGAGSAAARISDDVVRGFRLRRPP